MQLIIKDDFFQEPHFLAVHYSIFAIIANFYNKDKRILRKHRGHDISNEAYEILITFETHSICQTTENLGNVTLSLAYLFWKINNNICGLQPSTLAEQTESKSGYQNGKMAFKCAVYK